MVSEKPLGRVSITQIRSFCTLIDFRCRGRSRFLRFFKLITKLFPFVETRRWVRYAVLSIKNSNFSHEKLHPTRVKIVRVNVRFSFSCFNEANVNRKIYSIGCNGWNGPLPQRKKAFLSFSSFYNRHHRDRNDPLAHESSSLNSV